MRKSEIVTDFMVERNNDNKRSHHVGQLSACFGIREIYLYSSTSVWTKVIMSSFSLPTINDNPDGGWGPSSSNLPSQFKFKDIPYAPYSKSDKLGRFADWNDISGDNRQPNLGLSSAQNTRGGGPGGRGRRDGQPAFGSGTASAFAYFHAEDESSFSLVDTKVTATRRGGAMTRGRGAGRGGGGFANRGGAQRGGRGGFVQRGGGAQRGGRRGWRDWEKVCVIPTIENTISEIFCSLTVLVRHLLQFLPNGLCWRKLNSTDSPNCVWRLMSLMICMFSVIPSIRSTAESFDRETYGRLFAYDKLYDRITTKTEKPLQLVDRMKYNITTSDDPVMQEVSLSCYNYAP